ncbi:MAG: DUF4230 domain-containing protein [Minicystis sp.]
MTANAPRPLPIPTRDDRVNRAPSPPRRGAAILWWLIPATALLGLVAIGVLIAVRLQSPLLPPASTSVTVVRPSINVILSIRDLARLETNTFHLERVVDLSDQQTRLFGLVEAKDAILLVAVGDVVAGVDLQKLRDADVTADMEKKSVTVKLPAPEIFSTTLDNAKTRVFLRKTDTLAQRHEDLEERARREAAAGMEKAAREGGILDRARGGAEKAVRSLLRSAGFEEIIIEWRSE